MKSSINLFPHIILLPVSQAFAACKGLKRILCTGLICLGCRVGLGGVPVELQPFDLAAVPPCRFTQCLWTARELRNCTSSSRSTKSRFPCTHLHLMSSTFPQQTSPRAAASSHRYSVFVGCLAGPRSGLALRRYGSKL